MKIALLAHSNFPLAEPFAGGLEMITCELTLELMRRGHDVTVFAHPGSDLRLRARAYPTEREIMRNVEPGELASESLGAAEFVYQERYAWAMGEVLRGGFDVVHNHTLHHLPILLGERLGKRFITTLHAPAGTRLKLAFRSLPRPIQTVTCVSAHQKGYWETYTRIDRVIHNGVSLERWQPGSEREDYCLWMGRICPEKAPADAIKACLRAGKRLLLAGPVHDQVYFDEAVAPYLDDDLIVYMGHRTHAELAPLLAAARAFVFTSVYDEPYGLTLAEALASGTPVVAYRSGASPEIITPQVGTIVEKRDLIGLAEAIKNIDQIDRAACREHARRHCSITRMVGEYEDLYRSVQTVNGANASVFPAVNISE